MNQQTVILAESITNDLAANGREDIIAIAVLNLCLATEPNCLSFLRLFDCLPFPLKKLLVRTSGAPNLFPCTELQRAECQKNSAD